MRFNPRHNEVKAVAAVLEQEFASYEDAAKAVLQVVVDELAQRETTTVLAKFPQDWQGVAYGPYYHEGDVQKAIEKAREAGLETRIGRLCVPGRWQAEEALKTACVCGHQKEQHVVKNLRGGEVSAPKECGVFVEKKKKCSCNNYERKAS